MSNKADVTTAEPPPPEPRYRVKSQGLTLTDPHGKETDHRTGAILSRSFLLAHMADKYLAVLVKMGDLEVVEVRADGDATR